MADKLGILVSSDQHLDYVIGLARAACEKQIHVSIFFTGNATALIQSPELGQLKGKASLTFCDLSFQALGIQCSSSLKESCVFETQMHNAEIMKDCDRYVVF